MDCYYRELLWYYDIHRKAPAIYLTQLQLYLRWGAKVPTYLMVRVLHEVARPFFSALFTHL